MENMKCEWDLSIIYKDEKAFLADFEKASKLIKSFAKHEKTMCTSAENFYNTLKDMTDIDALIERLWQYASLGFAVDTSDNNAQALNARVRNLAVSAGEAYWFVSPYMLKLDEKTVERVRSELLEGDAVNIVTAMKQMGLSKAEAIALLEKYWD